MPETPKPEADQNATSISPIAVEWEKGSLRQVIGELARFGSHPAILTQVGGDEVRVSYEDLARRVENLTGRLRKAELGRGDRVAILAPNGVGWIAVALATLNAGAIAVPIDSGFDDESLGHVLEDAEPSLVFVGEDSRERVESLATKHAKTVVLDASGTDIDLPEAETGKAEAPPEPESEDTAVIFYTSGTTGPPKGVPLTHRNLLFEVHALLRIGLMSPGQRLLLPLPLHHVYPFVVGMLTPLAYGVGIALPQSMTGPHIMQAAKTFEVATLIGVPRLYQALLSGIEGRVAEGGRLARLSFRLLQNLSGFARRRLGLRLGSYLFRPLHRRIAPELRLLASGGAALEAATAWRLEGLGWTVATGYGLTETSPLLTIVEPGETRFETEGKPLPGVEIRIQPLSEQGAEEEDNAYPAGIGEIQVRGPNVFAGYRNLPERSREAFAENGWFRTEDRGWQDGEGYLHVLGRASTFVVTAGGKNISIEELERGYEQAPAIREIGIFMREDRLAAVAVPETSEVRKAGGESPENVVREAVRKHSGSLPRYKRVDDLVVSTRSLARTRLGKLRRNKLRQRFDTLRARGSEEETGPLPIDEMSEQDQALLESAPAREVWTLLSQRYPDIALTPDSDITLDLGIDSIEWINITLEIGERTGVELSEEATARVETVRDLLRETVEQAGQPAKGTADLGKEPEKYLSEEQRRWLAPLTAVESACAWALYWVNRLAVRSFFRLEISGDARLPRDGKAVVTPNHASVLDPFVICAALPYGDLRRSCFAGWTGLAFANPFFRFVSRLARTLPVRRDRAAFSSLALALAALQRGLNVVWFPEGQRSADGRLQAFQPGIGILLKEYPVRVVPVTIRGTFEAMPTGRRLPRPRRVAIHFGGAREAEDLASAGEGESRADRITDGLHRLMAAAQDSGQMTGDS